MPIPQAVTAQRQRKVDLRRQRPAGWRQPERRHGDAAAAQQRVQLAVSLRQTQGQNTGTGIRHAGNFKNSRQAVSIIRAIDGRQVKDHIRRIQTQRTQQAGAAGAFQQIIPEPAQGGADGLNASRARSGPVG